ncbi:hypothetical protein ACHAW5_002653 [Stephanodiscus triporus]|uniref:Adenine DNA glycosylase n=1 Tax=Stephanodiscus triporus TaxID=2934178 RepID=A0ABD3MCK8_9STRA
MTIAAKRILTLSSHLWNLECIAAFSNCQSNSGRWRTPGRTILPSPMSSSTHSSFQLFPHDDDNNADDVVEREGLASSIRRSPRRRAGAGREVVVPPSSSSSEDDDDARTTLDRWIRHDHHSYHVDLLSPEKAYEIRLALVNWYRANRRRLPWRGDAGPYDGSAAGYGSAAASGGGKRRASSNDKKRRRGEGRAPADIRSFFASSSSSSSSSSSLGIDGKRRKETNAESTRDRTTNAEEEADMEDGSDPHAPTRDVTAYGIWVSEVMLQQTRVEAVIPYWIKWMRSFPTVRDLAEATDEEVNSHWAGLGFYRRARLLHAGARRVANEYGGIVPDSVSELLKVEGVGRYTASAIASIAYGVEVPVVDGNVCRVLCRLTGVANHIKAGVLKDDLGWTLADRIVRAGTPPGGGEEGAGRGSPGEVNQALMELGATYCSPNGSGIDDGDPLREFYVSTRLGVAIGRAVRDAADRGRVESLVASEFASSGDEGGGRCRLCDPGGMFTAYYDIVDRIDADSGISSKARRENAYAIAGHSSIPISPPKKSKREEVIAVAVISLRVSNNDRHWLMAKRPSEGLLAGQWEFPSVCLWNSAEQAKGKGNEKAGKPPTVAVPLIDPDLRSDALNSFLTDIFESSDDYSSVTFEKRVQIKDAVVHVFSHVSHTMWVEHGEVEAAVDDLSLLSKRWKLNGREIGWMTEGDMESFGITSGVRKVLALTQRCITSLA